MNKKHWISITPHKNLTSDLLQDLIQDSYDLVVKTSFERSEKIKTNNIKHKTAT